MAQSPQEFNAAQAAAAEAATTVGSTIVAAANAANSIVQTGTSSDSTKSAFSTLAQGLTGIEQMFAAMIPGIGGVVGSTVAGTLGPTLNAILLQDVLNALGGLFKHLNIKPVVPVHPATQALLDGGTIEDAKAAANQ